MEEGAEAVRDQEESHFALETHQSTLGPAHFSLFVNFSIVSIAFPNKLYEERHGCFGGPGRGRPPGWRKVTSHVMFNIPGSRKFGGEDRCKG